MNRLKIYTVLFWLIAVKVGVAQNAAQDFKKINNVYKEHKLLSMDIEYIYYQDEKSKEATEIKKGYFKKNEENVISILMGVTTIQNGRYMLTIDDENKVIVVSKPKIEFNSPMITSIDSILKLCSSVNYLEPAKNEKAYQLNFKKNKGNYKAITIVYQSDNYFLKEMVFSFHEPVLTDVNDEASIKKIPKLVIKYSNIDTKTNVPLTSFSELKYFNKTKGNFIGVGKYKEYKFINNIPANEK